MKKILMSCAVICIGISSLGAALAQSTMPTTSPVQEATTPTSPAAQAGPPSMAAPQADLTGQTLYSAKGTKIGTVSSMTTDTSGQQQAVVSVQKFLGMGGKNVSFPVNSLSPRDGGGYITSLSTADIKALPQQ